MITLSTRIISTIATLSLLMPITLIAQVSQDVVPLKPWPVPLFWQPTRAESEAATGRVDAFNALSNNANVSAATPVGSLVFVAMTPCRIADTRTGSGFTGAFGSPGLVGGVSRTFPIQSSTTCTIPSIAQAYSFNITVVPPGSLIFITVWPTGQIRPNASTLNDPLGTIVANAAIVPAGTSGSVDVFASQNTDIIIDINGYYAPQSGVTLTQGSAGAPSLSFSGDAGTGIFSSTPGTLDFASAGVDRLTLRSDGRMDLQGKLSIHAQDGLQITGFEPFLTLADTNPNPINPVRTAIQSVDGDLVFYPNSSIVSGTAAMVIADGGGVGIGTATPKHRAAVIGGPSWTTANWTGSMEFANASAIGWGANSSGWHFGIGQTNGGLYFFQTSSELGSPLSPPSYIMTLSDGGLVGIGAYPDRLLTVNGSADKPGGGSWDVFSDERLKNIRGSFTSGLDAVMQLQPLRYEYKPDNALGIKSDGEHIGFSAQEVQQIIPEAVSTDDKGYLLVNNDPIMWTMLNAIKEQQGHIEDQQKRLNEQRGQILQQEEQNQKLEARLAALEALLSAKVPSAEDGNRERGR
jgi:hypothetical protein